MKVLNAIGTIAVIVGLLVLFFAVGASDEGAMALGEATVRAIVGISMVCAGLAIKVGLNN